MAWTALAVIVLLAGVLVTLAARRAKDGPTPDWVVEPVRLLAPAEQDLHAQLRTAFPQHVVLTQVSLARLLRLRRSGGSTRVFQPYLRMAVPFVVCSKEFMPLIVVDVNATIDAARTSREQRKRAAVIQASGLVYLAVGLLPGAVPSAEELRQRVRAALQAKSARGAGAPRAGAPSAAPVVPGSSPVAASRASTAAAAAGVRRLFRPLLARAPAPARQARAA